MFNESLLVTANKKKNEAKQKTNKQTKNKTKGNKNNNNKNPFHILSYWNMTLYDTPDDLWINSVWILRITYVRQIIIMWPLFYFCSRYRWKDSSHKERFFIHRQLMISFLIALMIFLMQETARFNPVSRYNSENCYTGNNNLISACCSLYFIW